MSLRETAMKRSDPVVLEAVAHSLAVHGDRKPHPECAECKRLAQALLDAVGVSLEQARRAIDEGPEHIRNDPSAALLETMFPRESAWD